MAKKKHTSGTARRRGKRGASGSPRAKRKSAKKEDSATSTSDGASGADSAKPLAVTQNPSSEDFAYAVADLAWSGGLTANSIARELWKGSYGPNELMQVKRALVRAKDQFLFLKPKLHEELSNKLSELFHKQHLRNASFVVVDDDYLASSGALFSRAAELVIELVDTVQQLDDDQVIISNAGGRTVWETVRAMQRNPPSVDAGTTERNRLEFVAANGAYLPQNFQQSANFLAVTMSQIYNAKHYAISLSDEDAARESLRSHVEKAKLFICGAGTRERGLMSVYFKTEFPTDGELPEKAVGDLAFNLLDIDGKSVVLNDEQRKLMDRINPCLTLDDMRRFPNLLLILDQSESGEKVHIGKAAILADVATHIVIGSKLARQIIAFGDRH